MSTISGPTPDEFGSQRSLASSQNPPAALTLNPRRWTVLIAMSVFGLTNMITEDLSTILRTMLELLNVSMKEYVYIGLAASYIPLLTTFPSAWAIEKFGFRWMMYLTTVIMLIRNGFRALTFNPDLPHWNEYKLLYYIISCLAGIQCISVFYCIPLKVSEDWFATSERSLAWAIMMSSGSIGDSIISFLLPRFIEKVTDVKPLFYVNLVSGIITATLVFTCITKSKPNHPPSERKLEQSSVVQIPFGKSCKRFVTDKDMMLQILLNTLTEGCILSVGMLLQDILLNAGHDRIFVGNLGSINAIVNLLALLSASSLVHRYKNHVSICKFAAALRLASFFIYLISILYHSPGWVVMTTSCAVSLASGFSSPNNNNMLAHLAAGLISEATLSAFSVIFTIGSMSLTRIFMVELIHTYGTKSDYSYSILAIAIICFINTFSYLIFFRGKRMTCIMEAEATEET